MFYDLPSFEMPQTSRSIGITRKGRDRSIIEKDPTEKVVLNVARDIDSTRCPFPLRSKENSLPSSKTKNTKLEKATMMPKNDIVKKRKQETLIVRKDIVLLC